MKSCILGEFLTVLLIFIQVSKISLVDLAGSERAKDTGAEGKRLQVKRKGERERGREEGTEGGMEGEGDYY